MRDLNDWLIAIEKAHPQTIELGLKRMREVAISASLLPFRCPVVTVAGTNGKGSTVATLAKLLGAAGLKVGTYTSPHLLRLNERIQLNGCCVSDEILCDAFEHIEKVKGNTALTFFEFITLAAFWIFQTPKYALDIVILEVGLGGRLDAVNVVDPNLVVITTIGYDHQEWLGNTLTQIATEKAGVMRANIPMVLSAKSKIDSLLIKAFALSKEVYIEGKDFDYGDEKHQSWQFHHHKIKVPTFHLPPMSVSLALAAYEILAQGRLLPKISAVIASIQGAMMMGRAHLWSWEGKTIVMDVAHNPEGSEWLASKLPDRMTGKKTFAVWASLKDKALAEIIKPIKAKIDIWHIGELQGVERASSSQTLAKSLLAQKISAIVVFPTILEAFDKAIKAASKGDWIVVFGSFYTVAAIYEKLDWVTKDRQNHNGLFDKEMREYSLYGRDDF